MGHRHWCSLQHISALSNTPSSVSVSLTHKQPIFSAPSLLLLISNSTPTYHADIPTSFLVHPLPSRRLRHSSPPPRPPPPTLPLCSSPHFLPLSPVAYFPSVSLIPHSPLSFSFLFSFPHSLLSIPPLPLGAEATEKCRVGFDHGSVNHNWGWRVAGWDPCTGKPWLACLHSASRSPRLPFSSLPLWACLCESESECMCIASHPNGKEMLPAHWAVKGWTHLERKRQRYTYFSQFPCEWK